MKKLFKNLIFSLCSILVCVGLVFAYAPKNLKNANAYVVSTLEEEQLKQQTEIVLSDASNGKKYLYLYPNSNDISSIKDAFSYYVNAGGVGNYHDNGNQSTDLELFHNLSYKAGHNDVIDSDDNGQFVSIINLSKNMIIAMDAGFVTNISASAQVVSTSNSAWNTKDAPETITMLLAVYKDNSDIGVDSSSSQKTTEYASVSAMLSNFAGNGYDTIALSFASSFTSIKAGFVNSTTGKNYMKVKLPTLEIVSSDTEKPTFSVSADNTWTNEERTVKISANDNESGLYKVEYRKQGESSWTLINDYAEGGNLKKSAETSFKVSENGTYEVKVTDNVGNETVSTFEESYIDKDAPSVKIDMAEVFTNKTISFDVSLIKNVLSGETYTFEYEALNLYGKEMTSSVSETGLSFVIGSNTVTVPENGLYNFRFNALDEAGNTMETIEISNVSVDDRQVVTLTVEETYTYLETNFEPRFVSSVSDNINILFTYKNEDETADYASIANVGNYYIYYTIDEESFKGSGKQKITILPKEIVLTNVQTEYEFAGKVFEPVYEISQDIELSVSVTKDNVLAELLNAGEYVVEFVPVSSNYNIQNSRFVVVIKKHNLDFAKLANSYEYDANVHGAEFSLDIANENQNIVLKYYDSNKNEIDSSLIRNAGNYYVVFEYVGDTNNFVFDKYTTLANALNLVITKRNLTVSANGMAVVYGEEIGELTYTLLGELENEPLNIFSLLLEKDNVKFDALARLNAGKYNILVAQESGLTAEEEQKLANYEVSYNSAELVVNQRQLEVVPTEKQSKVYGEEDGELTYSVSGLVFDDVLEGKLERVHGENVGYYNITIGSLNNPNYAIKLSSERFEITKRNCFIKVEAYEKTYGNEDPKFTFNKQKSNILSKDLEVFENFELFVRDAGENVGRYAINFKTSLLSRNEVAKNYYILTIPGKLVINKANVVVSADRIEAIYGEADKELTYSVAGIGDASLLSVVLTREAGENVGEYAISADLENNDNYEIEFVSNVYVINPREIEIKAIASAKTYGEKDNLLFEVVGTDEELDIITLTREAGENVGEYLINGYVFDNSNYIVSSFEPAILRIEKAKLDIRIDSKTKVFGTKDEALTYSVSGLVDDETLQISLVREAGENVGTYEILLGENNFANYEISSVVPGVYTIVKARLNYKLVDKTVTYSENQKVYIGKIDSKFEFEYVYEFLGTRMNDAPIDAGEYKAYAIFAGDENYEPYVTEKVNLVIKKKIIPITLKKSVFLYNGKAQGPELDINLPTKVAYTIIYTQNGVEVTDPTEVGEYNFTITSNDKNYTCSYTNVLHIVGEFFAENETGDASISSSSVSYSNSNIQIIKNNASKLMKKFNTIFDGRRCVAVYEFECSNSNNKTGDIFEVKIKAADSKNVDIYAVDKNGKLTKLSYSYIDGYFVLNVNSLASDIIITKTNQILKYAKIAVMAIVLVLSVFITKTINRHRKNNFFARNTAVKKFDKNLVKENIGIVTARIDYDEKIPVSEIIKK